MYVKPPYRRNGFATELIHKAIALAQNQDIDTITAQTLYGNDPAQKLFEHCGFSTISGKAVDRAKYGKQFGEYEHQKIIDA